MAENPSDLNLLFGVIALQMDFITRDVLVQGLNDWALDKQRSLGQILVAKGALTEEERQTLDTVVQRHVHRHSGDTAQSLQSFSTFAGGALAQQHVGEVTDNDVSASLSILRTHAPSSQQDYTSLGTNPNAGAARLAPNKVNRFTVVRAHARGGLGQVFVARDEELRREVALKEIHLQHAHDPYSKSRFVLEAEITGALEHPGIVPVYGLGVYEDGRPYYAMRFIQGTSLKEAIDRFYQSAAHLDDGQFMLGLRRLLTHIIEVCNAIEYAHSRAVIHRDLKPANIMLGKYGETLVVDWGLAKAMGSTSEGTQSDEQVLNPSNVSSTSPTMMGSVIGTPQYMSPEQAAGRQDVIGPASDVYSLGATLYSVLTGKSPVADTTDLSVVLRRVQQGDILRPRQHNPRIDAALDAVCMKAMAVDLQVRYRSAKALAHELERWMADEPVDAYVEPWNRRLARWGRRHRSWVLAGAIALVLIVCVSVMASWIINQSRAREAQAKQDATARSKQARSVIDEMLTNVGAQLEKYPNMYDARIRLLERAADDYERLTQENSKDPELQAESARSLVRLGDVRQQLNKFDAAAQSYNRADTVYTKLIQQLPQRIEFHKELGDARTQLGNNYLAELKVKEARTAFDSALDVLRPLAQQHPSDPDIGDSYAAVLVNLGRLQSEAKEFDAATESLKQAITVFASVREQLPKAETLLQKRKDLADRVQAEAAQDAGGPTPAAQELKQVEDRLSAVFRTLFAAAKAHHEYGKVVADAGREQDAVRIYQAAIIEYDQLIDQGSGDRNYTDFLDGRGDCRVLLGNTLREIGELEEVIQTYNLAVEDYQKINAQMPDVPAHLESLAATRANAAQAMHRLGDNLGAETEAKKALEEYQRLHFEYGLMPLYEEGLAVTQTTLGRIWSELGRQEDALKLLEESLLHYQTLIREIPDVPRFQERLATAHALRARALMRMQRTDEATTAYDEAQGVLRQLIEKRRQDPRPRDLLALTLTSRASQLQAASQTERVESYYRQLTELWERAIADFPTVSRFYDNLAWHLATCPVTSLRDPARAITLAQAATTRGPESAGYWQTLAACHLAQGESDSAGHAQAQFAKADAALASVRKFRLQDMGIQLFLAARVDARLGRLDSARTNYQKGVDWQKLHQPVDEDLERLRAETEAALPPAKE